jgi:protein-disulfide isomerase
VWRDYPLSFHRDAHLAAEAAREVYRQKGNDAFWRFRDILFANQKQLSRAYLGRYAQQMPGIDMDAFRAALDRGTHRAAVDTDLNAIERAGIQGTPSFLINGKLIRGAQPYEAFKVVLAATLR